ncbi:MAG: ATPase, partial [Clostridiales bacterium]|nr:ATPase [Clostridiales bacterium]
MRPYAIGLDGGGTRTLGLRKALDGSEARRCEAGALNVCGGTLVEAAQTLNTLLGTLSAGDLSECRAVCIGAAGISADGARAFLEAQARGLIGSKIPLLFVGDMETALAGAFLDGEPGAILVSGTGSFCYGQDAEGRAHRTGGEGHLLGDLGSAYAIGRDILFAVLCALDGRASPTALSGFLAKEAGLLTVRDIIAFAYAPKTGKGGIARLAPLAERAYAAGDAAASEILQRAAMALAGLARPVLERLGQSARLALCGGALENCAPLRALTVVEIRKAFPNLPIMR